jgi:hypothetical protein
VFQLRYDGDAPLDHGAVVLAFVGGKPLLVTLHVYNVSSQSQFDEHGRSL